MKKIQGIEKKEGHLKDHYVVSQSNLIIHAMCRLSLTAKKLMLAIISQIEPDDKEFKYYMIPVAEWKELAEISKSKTDYFKVLSSAADELRSKSLTLSLTNKVKVNLGLLSAVKDDQDRNMVGASFSPELKPYLLNLRGNFTSFQIKNIMKLRSNYSIRLYELLKTKMNLGIWVVTLATLRMEIGVVEGKYVTFSNFRRRILENSQSELAEKTDIRFEYKAIRKKRKIEALEIKIFSTIIDEDLDLILSKIMKSIPVTHRVSCRDISQRILKEKGDKCLEWIIGYVNGKKTKTNYGGYMRFALDHKLYDQFLQQKELEEKYIIEEEKKVSAQREDQSKKIKVDKEAIGMENYWLDCIQNLSPEEASELNELSLQKLNVDAEKSRGAKLRLERYKQFIFTGETDKAIKCLYFYRIDFIKKLKERECDESFS